MTLLIKNGIVVTASDLYEGDVFVDGEKISAIGSSLAMNADRVIDAKGKYLFPGGIDVHTHLDMPLAGRRRRMTSSRAPSPLRMAAQRPWSTSRFSTRVRRCTTHGTRG